MNSAIYLFFTYTLYSNPCTIHLLRKNVLMFDNITCSHNSSLTRVWSTYKRCIIINNSLGKPIL